MIDKPPSRVVYSYSEWQPGFDDIQKECDIEFVQGLGDILENETFFDSKNPTLLIIDDLARAVAEDTRCTKIFTQYLHHKNVCAVLILQNLYTQGKAMRDIHLNSQYLILFKSVRDVGQIGVLARQMGLPHIVEAYRTATSEPYTPLLLDMKPDTPEYLRVRSHFLPHQFTRLYLKKNASSLPKNVGSS
jgi:hypothetical protein